MFRSFTAAAILVSCFTAVGWAQSPPATSGPAASTPAKPVTKKAAPKAKAAAKQPVVAETRPNPREGLPAIVRSFTPGTQCERYLVVTRFKGQLPGTNLMLDGIGAYNRGLGTLMRHSHLFANISVSVLDGSTYEKINRPFANFGTRLSESMRV